MDDLTAARLIEALSSGANPFTGELLSPDHLCQHPDVIRALCLATRALEERRIRTQRLRNLPANVGKPWRPDETDRLIAAYQSGKSFNEIAQELKRTSLGVQARLERLGLTAPSAHRWSTQPAAAREPGSV